MKDTIESLKPWYQTIIEDDEILIKGHGACGDPAWPFIRDLLPHNLKNKYILDLGSNAGIHCIRAALENAKVIGIDALDQYIEQSSFIKKYFENKYKRILDIKFYKKQIEYIDELKLGKFDIVLAVSIIYHIGKLGGRKKGEDLLKLRRNTIKKICDLSKNIIITRVRKDEDLEWSDPMFIENGFKLKARNRLSRILSKYEC